jgi:hypothetical protein
MVDAVQNKVLRIPRSAANREADSKLGRESRRGKMLSCFSKYLVRVKQWVRGTSESVLQVAGWPT